MTGEPAFRLSTLLLLVMASAILIAGHLLPGLDGTLVEFGMRNSLHLVAFAAFGVGVFNVVKRSGIIPALLITLVIAATVGFAAELLQSARGKSPDLDDIYRDLIGTALGATAWYLWLAGGRTAGRPNRLALRAGATFLIAAVFVPFAFWLLVAVLNARSAPILVSFDRWWESHAVWEVNTRVERVPGDASIYSGHFGRFPLTPERRSGLSIFPGFTDWSGYRFLEFTVASVGLDEVDVAVRMNDGRRFRRYDGAFTNHVTATTEPTRIRLALADLASDPGKGQLDLTDVRQLTMLAARSPDGTMLVFDDIRLE